MMWVGRRDEQVWEIARLLYHRTLLTFDWWSLPVKGTRLQACHPLLQLWPPTSQASTLNMRTWCRWGVPASNHGSCTRPARAQGRAQQKDGRVTRRGWRWAAGRCTGEQVPCPALLPRPCHLPRRCPMVCSPPGGPQHLCRPHAASPRVSPANASPPVAPLPPAT